MKRNEAIKFVVLRSLGNFLVLFSLYGVAATFGPALTQQTKYFIIQARGVEFTVVASQKQDKETKSSMITAATPEEPGFADVLAGNKEQVLMPKDPLFSVLIPKIGASAQVFPNVDPENPKEFLPILQKGVAHAKGSVFPGHPGNTYLFAHSADNWWDVGRYNAIFYTLNNLSVNDEIVVFFENRRYEYVVSQKLISDPADTTLLRGPVERNEPSLKTKEQLVLQTCWPPGTTWKRLYIVATPKSTNDL